MCVLLEVWHGFFMPNNEPTNTILMKNAMILLAALVTIGLTSCKKDWTCTCTESQTSPDGTVTVSESDTFTIKEANRLDAKDACNEAEIQDGNYSKSCDLMKK